MPTSQHVDAARPPRPGGNPGRSALTEIHPQRLLCSVLAGLRDRNDLDSSHLEEVAYKLIGDRGINSEKNNVNGGAADSTALITRCMGAEWRLRCSPSASRLDPGVSPNGSPRE
jgi:hypothetical protein